MPGLITSTIPPGTADLPVVLLVDDESSIRNLLSAVLSHAGYTVLTAADGFKALARFQEAQRQIRLLVTDIDMPGMNGVVLAEKILALDPACTILFISGSVNAQGIEARHFLAKPFLPQVFLSEVQSLMPIGNAGQPLQTRQHAPIAPSEEGVRVVLAEDNEEMRERLRGILEPEFCVIGAFDDGDSLVERAAALRPNLILLDISMPRMNGFAAARVLHESMPAVPIVFVTQYADRAYVDEALRNGVAGYVLKRNVLSELCPALHQVQRGDSYVSPVLRSA